MPRGATMSEEFDQALLIAQTNTALKDLRALQVRVDTLTREAALLRAINAHQASRIVQLSARVMAMRAQAGRAVPRVFDAFARLVLEDIAARD